MARAARLLILTSLLLLSPAALAQPHDRAAADRLFKEGRAAFDKGDYAAACPKFAESQRADPAPGTLLNLALCEERSGKLASARQHVTELLPQLGPKDDRIPFAKDLLDKIEKRVARLRVTLAAGAPPETEVKLKQAGETKALEIGAETVLDPGDYELEITAPGRPESRRTLKLAEGQREERAIAPAEAETPKPPEVEPPPPSSAKLRRTLGIVAGGIGVASFGVAAATGALIVSKKSALDAECPTRDRCSAKGLDLAQSAQGLLPINTASWIVGIAGVGAGAVLILTSLGGDKTEPKVTAFPAALPGGAGVGVSGRF